MCVSLVLSCTADVSCPVGLRTNGVQSRSCLLPYMHDKHELVAPMLCCLNAILQQLVFVFVSELHAELKAQQQCN